MLSCAGQFKVKVFADLDAYADLDVYAADVDDELRAAAVAARRASGELPATLRLAAIAPGERPDRCGAGALADNGGFVTGSG